ncbi:MAG: YraN family protein [Pyrinomonadaceae bacterium]
MPEILSIFQQNNGTRASGTSSLGTRGEKLAVEHLINHGYRIVVTNFKVPVGRNSKGVSVTGEIDIIGLDGDTLCFVEVKTRRSEAFTPVITAVDHRKQRQITRTSKIYRRIFNLMEMPCRFDVVTVLKPKYGDAATIELTKDFWTETRFRKRTWRDDWI